MEKSDNINYTYKFKKTNELSLDEINAMAELYSYNYGVWSSSDKRAGKNVRMSTRYFSSMLCDKPDRYVVMVYTENELVGHAIYMRRGTSSSRYIYWILQLVVSKKHRGHKLGTKLMSSIWGLSDGYAWGLYTANPSTIRALEDATFRKVDVGQVNCHIQMLKEVANDIFNGTEWIDNYENGIVNTCFFVDHSDIPVKLNKYFSQGNVFTLPRELPEGKEWLAFVFDEQPCDNVSSDRISTLLNYSDEILKNAYKGMHLGKQPWAKHTKTEVDFILRKFPKAKRFIDVGCGEGRHTKELMKRGYQVRASDFVEERIEKLQHDDNYGEAFKCIDWRFSHDEYKADIALCLYDIVGSFEDEIDNLYILRNIYKSLRWHGRIIISVMNSKNARPNYFSGLTKKGSISRLIRLKGSNNMQNNGDVFVGKNILFDFEKGIWYRKEQFFSEDTLPREYIVRDRRYSTSGICRLLRAAGFAVDECYCVQAGRFETKLLQGDEKAKEILVIAHKKWFGYKYYHKHDSITKCWE